MKMQHFQARGHRFSLCGPTLSRTIAFLKMRCDHRSCNCNLMIANFKLKKTFRVSTGFELMASALAL